MSTAAQILAPGDRCTATGWVVSINDRVTLEPGWVQSLPRDAVSRAHPLPEVSSAFPLEGADLSNLLDREQQGDALRGWATFDMIWRSDSLQVVRQHAHRPELPPLPPTTVPPCPAPEGGWLPGPFEIPPAYEELRTSGLIATARVYYPAVDAGAFVVCAYDPAHVTKLLAADGPRRNVCVIPSRYTQAEIDRALQDIQENFYRWQLFKESDRTSNSGQRTILLMPVRLLPEMAAWALTVPEGLVQIDPWLRKTA